MKKVIISTVILLLATIQMQSQWFFGKTIKGNGNVISKTINTNDYDEVFVTGSFDVKLIHGNEGKIGLRIEDNLLEYLIIETEEDKLVIKWKKGVNIQTKKGVFITVPFKDLDKVGLTGSGDIIANDVIKASHFNTFVSGSGDVVLNIDAHKITSKITGSGDVELKGNTDTLNTLVTGSGDFKSYDLKANNVEATVTGSGDIQIFVSNKLNARVTGSGDIQYKGNPKYEDLKVTGSGDIESY